MDFSKVTVQDCIDMSEKKDKGVVLNDGQVLGFSGE